MIVNHTHSFIFLKVSKTGGSSVEGYLRRFCHPGDIVTWLDDDEEAEIRSTGVCPPMGFTKGYSNSPLWARALMALNHRKTLRRYGVSPHAGAKRVKAYVGERVWESHYKFCVVRHPLDRALSQYFWTAANRGWKDAVDNFRTRFDEFLACKDFLRLNEKGRDVYSIDGRIEVDRVLRFENMAAELGEVLSGRGIDTGKVILPRFKSTQRPKGDFAAMLTQTQRKIIADSFAFEIEYFGYAV